MHQIYMEPDEYESSTFFPGFIGAVIGGLIVAGFFMWFGGSGAMTPSQMMAGAYKAAVMNTVSPADLLKWIEMGDTEHTIVDVRTPEDYHRGHIVGSVNIPVSTLNGDSLVDAFNTLPEGKSVILYSFDRSSTLDEKAADMLAERGVYVKVLTIGWNEWRYDWKMWNGQKSTTSPLQYSWVGDEPGKYPIPQA